MSFFGVNVNPFSTPVGQRIEQATDGGLASENWALNMEICDIVNETEDGPRDAIKAIKRRLNQAASKNYTVVVYTLVVLETCVKNCGKRFHALAFARDFVQELVKTIGPKNEPPTVVQEKVLSLIRAWADTFRHEPHAQGVCQVYQELRTKGIQFPLADQDATAPIMTPQRSIPEADQSTDSGPLAGGQSPVTTVAAAGAAAAQTGTTLPTHLDRTKEESRSRGEAVAAVAAAEVATAITTRRQQSAMGHANESGGGQPSVADQPQATPLHEELVAKLRSELDVVQGNMRVLSEMLTYLTSPEQTAAAAAAAAAAATATTTTTTTTTTTKRQLEPADLELLQQLYTTCKSMQERVVELIGRLVDDEMTAELLEINDELNNLFLCYSRYSKNKVGSEQSSGVAAATTASAVLARTIGQQQQQASAIVGTRSNPSELTAADADSLIDLSDGLDSLATQVSNTDICRQVPVAAGGTTSVVEPRDKEHESDEFAMFAQSRNNCYETRQVGRRETRSKYEDNTEPTPVKEGVDGGILSAVLNAANSAKSSPQHQRYTSGSGLSLSNTPNPGDRGDTESLTSSEFERFLAERAAAAEALPTLPVVTAAAPVQSTTSNPAVVATGATGTNIQRQINKDQDKSLFAL